MQRWSRASTRGGLAPAAIGRSGKPQAGRRCSTSTRKPPASGHFRVVRTRARAASPSSRIARNDRQPDRRQRTESWKVSAGWSSAREATRRQAGSARRNRESRRPRPVGELARIARNTPAPAGHYRGCVKSSQQRRFVYWRIRLPKQNTNLHPRGERRFARPTAQSLLTRAGRSRHAIRPPSPSVRSSRQDA